MLESSESVTLKRTEVVKGIGEEAHTGTGEEKGPGEEDMGTGEDVNDKRRTEALHSATVLSEPGEDMVRTYGEQTIEWRKEQ